MGMIIVERRFMMQVLVKGADQEWRHSRQRRGSEETAIWSPSIPEPDPAAAVPKERIGLCGGKTESGAVPPLSRVCPCGLCDRQTLLRSTHAP